MLPCAHAPCAAKTDAFLSFSKDRQDESCSCQLLIVLKSLFQHPSAVMWKLMSPLFHTTPSCSSNRPLDMPGCYSSWEVCGQNVSVPVSFKERTTLLTFIVLLYIMYYACRTMPCKYASPVAFFQRRTRLELEISTAWLVETCTGSHLVMSYDDVIWSASTGASF
jgi:hypothetical protein